MKQLLLCLLTTLCVSLPLRADTTVPRLSPLPRDMEKISLSGTWTFNGAHPIEVPGEWVMQGFEVEPGREATYERTFDVPARWQGRRVKLRCNAVYSKSRIFVNDRPVGTHLGGFTAFELDVTDALRFGRENSIRVGVTSESVADSTSSGSTYAVHPLGGITRDLFLFALPEVNLSSFHVQTFFDSLYTDATLRAQVEVAAESNAPPGELSLRFVLTDKDGRQVLSERRRAATGYQEFDFL